MECWRILLSGSRFLRFTLRARSALVLFAILAAMFLPQLSLSAAYGQAIPDRRPGESSDDYWHRRVEAQRAEDRRRVEAQRAEDRRRGEIAAKEDNETLSQQLIVMVSGQVGDAPTIGAGIVFGRDKDKLYLLTANHVVRRGNVAALNLLVKVKTLPTHPFPAQLLAHFDAEMDLAVIGVEGLSGQGVDVCALDFSRLDASWNAKRGDGVYAVGNPNGIGWAMSVSPEPVAKVVENQVLFQSTFISQGHSGGALLNERGLLVGMIRTNEPPYASAITLGSALQTIRGWDYPIDLSDYDAPLRPLLNAAAAAGDTHAMQRMLAACGGDANTNITRPLFSASAHGQVAAVKLLVAAGADVNTESGSSASTPLEMASGEGQIETMKVLLSLGARVNQQHSAYRPALEAAAQSGSLDAVKLLLAHGADVNATEPRYGTTPIYLAAYLKHAEVVELLIAAGANVNCRRTDGETPLHAAVENRDARTAKALVAAGADVNAKDKNGVTPLNMIGSSSDDAEWQALLLSHGGKK